MKIKCTSSFYIVNKGVFDNGSIVEFDDELALKLIKQGVAVEYIEEIKTIEKEEIDYNDLTVKELKEILEQKGLSTKGKKAELIQRLEEN
jgi:hypothetical protein